MAKTRDLARQSADDVGQTSGFDVRDAFRGGEDDVHGDVTPVFVFMMQREQLSRVGQSQSILASKKRQREVKKPET
jgi:hypothetical protein